MEFCSFEDITIFLEEFKNNLETNKTMDFLEYENIKEMKEGRFNVKYCNLNSSQFESEKIKFLLESIYEIISFNKHNMKVKENEELLELKISVDEVREKESFDEYHSRRSMFDFKANNEIDLIVNTRNKKLLNVFLTDRELKEYNISYEEMNKDVVKEEVISKPNKISYIDKITQISNNTHKSNEKEQKEENEDEEVKEEILFMAKQMKKYAETFGSTIKTDIKILEKTEQHIIDGTKTTQVESKKIDDILKNETIGLFTQIIYLIVILCSFLFTAVIIRIFPKFI